jgi:uncharacterized membrane protein YfcA
MWRLAGYILALVIGLSLSLIGGGGSILAVPILKYVMGVPVSNAIAMSLFIVGTVSAIGAVPHWWQGNISWRTVALFTPVAMIGAYLGARLAGLPTVTPTLQLVTFALVMVAASVMMIRQSGAPPIWSQADDASQVSQSVWMSKWLIILLAGLGVGVLTGFVGVGGGFLIIPALVLLAGLPMKQAVGTSLVIIFLNSVTGFWGYLSHVTLDWPLMISFSAVAAIGTLIGAYLNRLIDSQHLQKGFGYFVLVVAVFILVKR